eukprot:366431-Chlamydomonas_euryale.AAC.1
MGNVLGLVVGAPHTDETHIIMKKSTRKQLGVVTAHWICARSTLNANASPVCNPGTYFDTQTSWSGAASCATGTCGELCNWASRRAQLQTHVSQASRMPLRLWKLLNCTASLWMAASCEVVTALHAFARFVNAGGGERTERAEAVAPLDLGFAAATAACKSCVASAKSRSLSRPYKQGQSARRDLALNLWRKRPCGPLPEQMGNHE